MPSKKKPAAKTKKVTPAETTETEEATAEPVAKVEEIVSSEDETVVEEVKEKKEKRTQPDYWLKEAAFAEEFDQKLQKRIYTPITPLWAYAGPFIGRKISIIGEAHRGKSTLCYFLISGLTRTCVKCMTPAIEWKQKDGSISYHCRCGANQFMNGILADVESSATVDYLKAVGVKIGDADHTKEDSHSSTICSAKDAGKLFIFRPINLEQMYEVIDRMLLTGNIHFVVLDPLNTLQTVTQEEATEIGGPAAMAARIHWSWLKKLNTTQEKVFQKFGHRPTIIWTNHLIGAFSFNRFAGPQTQESGGKGVKALVDQRIEMVFTKKNPSDALHIKEKKDMPAFDVCTEYSFKLVKSKTGVLTGAGGSFVVFESTFKTKAMTYKPGMTDDANYIFRELARLGLFRKIDKPKGYVCLGKWFPTMVSATPFLTREDIQFEARYWIGRIILPDLAKRSLKLEDYFYNEDPDEKERVAKLQEDFEKVYGAGAAGFEASATAVSGEAEDSESGSDEQEIDDLIKK